MNFELVSPSLTWYGIPKKKQWGEEVTCFIAMIHDFEVKENSSPCGFEQGCEDQSQVLCETWVQRNTEVSTSCPSRCYMSGHWT